MALLADVISIGVDLAQRVDFTAIMMARVTERPYQRLASKEPRMETFYDVRFPKRFNGAPYEDVGLELRRLIMEAHALPPEYDETSNLPGTFAKMLPREINITIDSTGVGVAAVETIQRVIEGAPYTRLIPVMITSGTQKRWTNHGQWSGWNVSKGLLVSRLAALMQKPPHVGLPPDTPEREALIREIHEFSVKVSRDGHDTYGAPERTGAHDDLVTALALCCLDDPQESRASIGPKLW